MSGEYILVWTHRETGERGAAANPLPWAIARQLRDACQRDSQTYDYREIPEEAVQDWKDGK